MTKLKVLNKIDEGDRMELDRVSHSISAICTKINQLEDEIKNNHNKKEIKLKKIELKKNLYLLEKVSEELDNIFDF